MRHVDALSRSVAYINELPLERELELRQLTDPKIQDITTDLEYSENEKFALINGLVYRKDNGNLKFVVLDVMIPALIRIYHDDMALWSCKDIRRNFTNLLVPFDAEKDTQLH